MTFLPDTWAIQRFLCRNISGLLHQVSCFSAGTSRTWSRCLQLSSCPLRMQGNVKCYFPMSWPDESFQSLQKSIPQCSVGGWGWSQNHTGMDPGYGTGRHCECRQLFSLCLCTVDSERVLPKSPWIPLTNVVRSSPTLTWFVPFIAGPSEDHYGLLRPLHWKKLRGLEVLGVYSAWGSDGRWCNGIKVQWPWLHAGQALLWNSPPEILLQIRLRLTSNPRAAVTLLHHVSFTSTPISSGNTFVFLIINFTIE